MDCPKCGSSNTVKKGNPEQRLHGEVQICRCKDCHRQFTYGQKKMLELYVKNKLVARFREGILNNYCSDVSCPNCGEHQAFFDFEFTDKSLKTDAKLKMFLCLGCGHKFRGNNCCWNNSLKKSLSR